MIDAKQEQIAIDTCISAVQIYFPCEAVTPVNHTCLCEQYAWHVACYDNHASHPYSRANADAAMRDSCLAAGSNGAATIQRRDHQDRRQIGSILNSVGGVAASFLSKQSVSLAIPTAIPSLPGITPARTTSQATFATPNAQSSARTPTTLSSTVSPTASQSTSSQAASSSSKSSKPSAGLIAGAVIGGIAVLLLLAILIMLVLRHRRKKRQTPLPQTHSPMLEDGSHRSLDETLVDRTPMTESRVPAAVGGYGGHEPLPVGGYMHNEKDVYRSSHQDLPMPTQSEMETSANVWEIDGREKPRPLPTELESPIAERGHMWNGRNEARRNDRAELHF